MAHKRSDSLTLPADIDVTSSLALNLAESLSALSVDTAGFQQYLTTVMAAHTLAPRAIIHQVEVMPYSPGVIAAFQEGQQQSILERFLRDTPLDPRLLAQPPVHDALLFRDLLVRQAAIIPTPHEADQMSAAEYHARYIDPSAPGGV